MSSLRRLAAGGVAAGLVAAAAAVGTVAAVQTREYKSGVVWPEPAVIDPGPVGGPPSDAVVLFDGKDTSKWKEENGWELKEGYGVIKSRAGVNTNVQMCIMFW